VAVAVADFNGDQKPDLVVANEEGDSVTVFLGQGALQFLAHGSYSVGGFPENVVAGDFDGDGKPDVATSSNFDDKVVVLFGVDGSLAMALDEVVGPSPYGLTAADFNKDGKVDIACANLEDGTVSVLLNAPAATQCVGDCNGDGAVTVNELVLMVNVALESAPASTCAAGDADSDGMIQITEIVGAVNNALGECPAVAVRMDVRVSGVATVGGHR
jgi:hypothetical protein